VTLIRPFEDLTSGLASNLIVNTPAIEGSWEASKLLQAFNDYAIREKILTEENQKQALLAQIGGLARQVAHDVRSPLSVLKVIAAKDDFSTEYAKPMKMATDRIETIADDLLGMRYRTGRKSESPPVPLSGRKSDLSISPHTERVALFQLFDDIRASIELKKIEYSSLKNININYYQDDVEPKGYVHVIVSDLLRAISNLVNNSVEALEAGGFISITGECEVSTARLTIRDNGRGITKDILKKILSEGGTYNKIKGHGLGLSHTRKIIQSYGGQFKIISESGRGVIVTISLPLSGTVK
ncbi:HAMP domain-containing sensor histidine kinase, partial [Bdellovibrionales bacterium]|nr:HAMP domain-containing sensor histidine kinase [Bdellovibrionales bacterium]